MTIALQRLRLLDRVAPGQRQQVGRRQRILDGQILQNPARRGRQTRDVLLDLGG